MKISIGPVPVQWTRNNVMTFYDAVALSSVDVVYIGDTVCAPHLGVHQRDRLAIARELARTGKEIVMSIRLGNCGAGSFNQWKWIVDGEFPVEADDLGALRLVAGQRPFIVGSAIPCDSEWTLDRLVGSGARRRVLPALCKGEALQALLLPRNAACEMELPVLSPRQFSRWQCQVGQCAYKSLSVHSLSGCDLASAWEARIPDWQHDLKALRAEGISVLRIVARSLRAVDVAQILSELVRDEISPNEAYGRYKNVLPQVLRKMAS